MPRSRGQPPIHRLLEHSAQKLWDDYGSRLELHFHALRQRRRHRVVQKEVHRLGESQAQNRPGRYRKCGVSVSARTRSLNAERIENLVHQQVNPDNLTAALGQVEAFEALSLYRSMDIYATARPVTQICANRWWKRHCWVSSSASDKALGNSLES